MKVKDPVCGMIIDSEKAAARGKFLGMEVYFCSSACATKYAQAHPVPDGLSRAPNRV
jgi:YHS domain-containing protein